jgi:hypothetical protein
MVATGNGRTKQTKDEARSVAHLRTEQRMPEPPDGPIHWNDSPLEPATLLPQEINEQFVGGAMKGGKVPLAADEPPSPE